MLGVARAAVRIAIPVILPRAFVLWGLIRLVVAALPLAAGHAFGSMSPSPLAIVLLCGVVGLIDVQVRGEPILWANLGVARTGLYVLYAATAVLAESLLALARR